MRSITGIVGLDLIGKINSVLDYAIAITFEPSAEADRVIERLRAMRCDFHATSPYPFGSGTRPAIFHRDDIDFAIRNGHLETA